MAYVLRHDLASGFTIKSSAECPGPNILGVWGGLRVLEGRIALLPRSIILFLRN